MKISRVGSNQTILTLSDDTQVLFSYNTPVAAQLSNGEIIRTSQRWSKTTSKHITRWLDDRNATTVDQSVLDSLVK